MISHQESTILPLGLSPAPVATYVPSPVAVIETVAVGAASPVTVVS
jgi:hypothetical protein